MLNTEARRWTSSANVHWVTERVGRGQGCRDEGWESHWYLGHDVAMSSWTPSASLGLGFLSSRRKWQPTPVLLPGKSQGWRILAGYSPWVRKESDTTEWLHFIFFPLFSRQQPFFENFGLCSRNKQSSPLHPLQPINKGMTKEKLS